MTDTPLADSQTTPTDPGPEVPPDTVAPSDPPIDPPADPPKAPRKRAAAKKAAAPSEKGKAEPRSVYLPALPDGFHYSRVSIDGPNGAAIDVSVSGDEVEVKIASGDLDQSKSYGSIKAAVAAAAKGAKGLSKIADREAELRKAREEALDL